MHVIVLLPIKQFVVKPLSRENPHAKFTFFLYISSQKWQAKRSVTISPNVYDLEKGRKWTIPVTKCTDDINIPLYNCPECVRQRETKVGGKKSAKRKYEKREIKTVFDIRKMAIVTYKSRIEIWSNCFIYTMRFIYERFIGEIRSVKVLLRRALILWHRSLNINKYGGGYLWPSSY